MRNAPSIRRGRPSAAFTLTELLVCIAIIGVLAALVFAVVGTIRGNAVRAQCASNLRQCALAINLYAADNRGMAPSTTWSAAILPYISGFKVNASQYATLQTAFPISCPGLEYDNSQYDRSTYSLNSWLDTDHSNQNTGADGKVTMGWSMPLRNVESPARKIMLFDGRLASTAENGSRWAFNAVKGAEYIDFRHLGSSANILFVDGHVKALKAADIEERMWDWRDTAGDGSP